MTINLIGKKYNDLEVLYKDEEKSKIKGRYYWICRCKCGVIKSLNGGHLIAGNYKNCGCEKTGKQRLGEFNFNALLRVYKQGATNRGVAFLLTDNEFRINALWLFILERILGKWVLKQRL